jgi:hypothetical protein
MSEKVETLAAPALRFGQLREYLAERFPVPVTLVLSAAIGAAAYATAQGATLRAGAPLLLDGAALGGVVMTTTSTRTTPRTPRLDRTGRSSAG